MYSMIVTAVAVTVTAGHDVTCAGGSDSALRTSAQAAADLVRSEADVQIQSLKQQVEEAKTDMALMHNRFEEGEIKGAMREMENSAHIDHRLRVTPSLGIDSILLRCLNI